MKVALFITCFNDTLFPDTGRAVVELLERLGHEVAFPEEQTCCGQMHFNTGYADDGLALARRFERVFDPYEAVVSPSASCVGMVRDHCPAVADRVFELTEFLVDRLGVVDVGATFPHRVTLHPTCHSLRLLKLGDRPRRLLEAVQGLELVDLEEPQECCGFGGTFAVKNADTSMAMLSDKLRRILDTRAEVCTAADNSCLMHIGGALRAPAHRRAGDAPRRDPGGDRVKGFPAAARESLAGLPAAPQPRQGDADDPRQAAADDRRAARLGAAARGGRRDQGAGDGDAARAARAPGGRGHPRRRHRPLGARRRRGDRDRRPHRARARARAR